MNVMQMKFGCGIWNQVIQITILFSQLAGGQIESSQRPTEEQIDFFYDFLWENFEMNFPGRGTQPTLDLISKDKLIELPGKYQITYFPGIDGFEEIHAFKFTPKNWRSTSPEEESVENGYWIKVDPNKVVLFTETHDLRAYLLVVGGKWNLLDAEGESPLKPMRKIGAKAVLESSNPKGISENSKAKLPLETLPSTGWPRSIGNGPIMIPDDKCVAQIQDDVVLLSGNGRMETVDPFSPPVKIRATAMTDVTNIRLYYGKGSCILNWELNPRMLRMRDPQTQERHAFPGKGFAVVNEWHQIEWIISSKQMQFLVDGELRAKVDGDYADLKATAGIGAAHGSIVSVTNFQVMVGPAEKEDQP